MAYTVVRTDNLSGTDVRADLISLRVYDANDKEIDVENGTIVEVVGHVTNEREIYKTKLATSSSDLEKCYIVASPEVMYDERKKNLDEFINVAGEAASRGYAIRHHGWFSITKEGFVGGTAPASVGATVGVGANGKLDASGSGFGVVDAIETAGRYTYYVIDID